MEKWKMARPAWLLARSSDSGLRYCIEDEDLVPFDRFRGLGRAQTHLTRGWLNTDQTIRLGLTLLRRSHFSVSSP